MIEEVNEIEDFIEDLSAETEKEELYETIQELKSEIEEMRMAENDIDQMLHPDLVNDLYELVDEFLDALLYSDYDSAYSAFTSALSTYNSEVEVVTFLDTMISKYSDEQSADTHLATTDDDIEQIIMFIYLVVDMDYDD